MKNGKTPNPNTIQPITGYDREIYVKPTIQNPNNNVGIIILLQLKMSLQKVVTFYFMQFYLILQLLYQQILAYQNNLDVQNLLNVQQVMRIHNQVIVN